MRSAVSSALALAEAEAPRAAFTVELGALERALEDADRDRVAVRYVRARRALVSSQPSDALLDAWERIATAWRAPVQIEAVEFRGRVGMIPIRLTGRDHDELFRACESVLSRGPRLYGELSIDGMAIVDRRGALSVRAMCAIAVLNARPRGQSSPEILRGRIGRIPFALRGPADRARALAQRYVPYVVRHMTVRTIAIECSVHEARASFSPAEAVALIERALDRRDPS